MNRGADWNKWDLHIHSPESALANEYVGRNNQEKWEMFISEIEKHQDLLCLGITDYFSIKGYKRIIEYKEKGRLKNVKMIIPNIELRILPVTELNKAINLHLLVNPSIVDSLETVFFNSLEFEYNGNTYKCTDSDLIRLGKVYKDDDQLDEKTAYIEGVNQFKTTIKDLKRIIDKNILLKKNIIIALSNNRKDGNSGIKHSSLTSTRQEIYRFSDCIFSGNPADSNYFLGKGKDDKDKIVKQYGSIKPCIHGSDAHCIDKIFKPDLNRFTWIKSELSFSGLKQIIYEPELRVKIQEDCPQNKPSYKTIKRIRYVDKEECFTKQWIGLNKDLNSIIGGKSSGKSMLLYNICNTIDPKQIEDINSDTRFNKVEYNFDEIDGFGFEVEWDDGKRSVLGAKDNPNRPITYIPQLFLNRLAEERKYDLNNLVDGMLRERNEEYKKFRENTEKKIQRKNKQISNYIDDIILNEEIIESKKNELKKLGDKEGIVKNINKLKNEISILRKKSKFTDEEERAYIKLNDSIEVLSKKIKRLSNKKEFFNFAVENFIGKDDYLQESLQTIIDEEIIPFFSGEYNDELEAELLSRIKNINDNTIEIIINKIQEEFSDLDNLSIEISGLRRKKKIAQKKIEPFLAKISNQNKYDKLNAERKKETGVLDEINSMEKELTQLQKKTNYDKLTEFFQQKIELFSSVKKRNEDYKIIPDSSDIELITKMFFDESSFKQHFSAKINKKLGLKQQFGEMFNNDDNFIFSEETHVKDIEKILNAVLSEKIKFNAGYDKKDILKSLFGDYISIDYDLIQNGDNLLKMSPGKRGIILFQIFLHLSKSSDPILLDQPEDNLDNRTVYNELNDFIRKKKLERQIIIVSHNPNLVVATDSDNVIVANQDGQNKSARNENFKFEYINGALENSFTNNKVQYILKQKGIKEHVCEILEGGIDAFEKRELKYGQLKP